MEGDGLIQISKIALGTEVFVGVSKTGGISSFDSAYCIGVEKVCIVGRSVDDDTGVAWNGYSQLSHGYGRQYFDCWDSYGYRFIDGWKEKFAQVSWLRKTFFVRLAEKPVLFPDQKCAVCLLPAPHTAPNKDGKFVCACCVVLALL